MDISFFRSRIPGPEIALEDAVTNNLSELAPKTNLPSWVACSPRIGAGLPDILFAYYEPQILAISRVDYSQTQLIAYLRAVNHASLDSIMNYFKFSKKTITGYLSDLMEICVVSQVDQDYYLEPLWKDIIPTIISIEVKVSDWRKAISQASRNRLFCHKSYIALPRKLASRIKDNPVFEKQGLGLLSIENGTIIEEIIAPSTQPQVWEYYYRLAAILANCG